MKLKDLLDLIRPDQQFNIFDEVNYVYLHQNIFKKDCNNRFYSYEVVEIMTNINDYGYPIIEINVAGTICNIDW